MKVLMFGWEFPPLSSGGLGTACYGLVKGLSNNHIAVTFVLPYAADGEGPAFVNLISPGNVKIKKIDSFLKPYLTSTGYARLRTKRPAAAIYGESLFDEVHRYTQSVREVVELEEFDIIHCHDWMTFGAGILAKELSGKPLVVHVHATEFDRSGGQNVNQYVYDLERQGLHAADRIIAVSNYTKKKIVDHYDIHPDKVFVVHNAVDLHDASGHEIFNIKRDTKVVLFLGRITIQKGPDYFIYAAKKVLDHMPNVVFVMAGTGDMEPFIIEKAAELGISDKLLFAGFLQGEDVDRAYKMADLYIMPSVSEPFGITPLEAMKHDTPVIISKQSGVSEVIHNCLKVDFWDVDQIASNIIATLQYSTLHESLRDNARAELRKFSWDNSARKCIDVYQGLL